MEFSVILSHASIVRYKGRSVLMYRIEGESVWRKLWLDAAVTA